MKISDLSALLTKVQQIAGDVEVAFKAAESEAETVITDLGLHLDPNDPQGAGKLTIEHGATPAATPAADEQPAAEGDADNPAGT